MKYHDHKNLEKLVFVLNSPFNLKTYGIRDHSQCLCFEEYSKIWLDLLDVGELDDLKITSGGFLNSYMIASESINLLQSVAFINWFTFMSLEVGKLVHCSEKLLSSRSTTGFIDKCRCCTRRSSQDLSQNEKKW